MAFDLPVLRDRPVIRVLRNSSVRLGIGILWVSLAAVGLLRGHDRWWLRAVIGLFWIATAAFVQVRARRADLPA